MKERLRGYRDALEASPQIKITRVVDMKGDSRVAFDTATEILGKDKKERTDAFVCLEALAGKEVATVLSQHGVKDKIVLAMDTDEDTLSWIQKGVIAATISQKPYTMSFVGLKDARRPLPSQAEQPDCGLGARQLCSHPGICRYRIVPRGQNQRGCTHRGKQVRNQQRRKIDCNTNRGIRDAEGFAVAVSCFLSDHMGS